MAEISSLASLYVGYDGFQDAMLAHADKRKAEGLSPQTWNEFQAEAAIIAREAGIPDAPSGSGINAALAEVPVHVVCRAGVRVSAGFPRVSKRHHSAAGRSRRGGERAGGGPAAPPDEELVSAITLRQ